MFIVWTVLACVACVGGYELNWIRQRHALIARQKVLANTYQYGGNIAGISLAGRDGPGLLWLFGERKVFQLILIGPYEPSGPPGTTTVLPGPPKHPDYLTARRLFPEAEILVMGLQKPIAR